MKIICSDGPKIGNTESLYKLYQAGMDTIRFNFSHADYNTTAQLMKFARENCPNLEILQDLQGVKLRVSQNFPREIKVLPGQDHIIFCSEQTYQAVRHDNSGKVFVPIQFDGEFSALQGTKTILMKDATMEFKVEGMQNEMILTTVTKGGIIRARKAINAPGMDRSNLDLTEKDQQDLLWGLEHGVDIVCLSFVCNSEQIKKMKDFILKEGKIKKNSMPKIWAKIETREGVDNFSSILRSVDGIMLGRGDLAPEIGIYEVPEVQAELLKKMKKNKKDFIIATQVLESMTRSQVPNRAELNDIYYCIQNNASGFMLTAETGIGWHPVLAVKTLKDMIDRYGPKNA
ncbi:MAG: pyruvate kinase [Desulfococcaceae bacterium]|jgi:pyruvate kinase|nr:pyruvate kinase [Desulfococcaceae bacterium]